MKSKQKFRVKLVHCGNVNLAHPDDKSEKYVFFMPMGIYSLASELNGNGHDAEIIHLDLEANTTKTIEKILDFETIDAVGFDLHWAHQSVTVLDTLQSVKTIKPDIHVFLGGYTATFFAEEILRDYPEVDSVIRGDGEIPLKQLCDALRDTPQGTEQRREAMENVRNLTWRNEKQIVSNKTTYISTTEEISRFGFANLELLRNWEMYRDLSRYWTQFPPFNAEPFFFLELGRGCSYNCVICGGNANAQKCLNNRKGQIVRTVDSVVRDMKKCMSYGYKTFFSCFDFDGCEQWYTQLFREVTEEKLAINFAYETWSIPTTEMVDAMSAGSENVIIAISPDTANETLRLKNKDHRLHYTNRQLENILDYICTKPNTKIQLWFGYFLPDETEETVTETLNYILELYIKYAPDIEISYMNINTDPASSLYFEPERYGFDVAVKQFEDYTRKLREDYIREKDSPEGITLMSKPSAITSRRAAKIANQITYFNNLLKFRNSLVELTRINREPRKIVESLKKMDLSTPKQSDFSPDNIKQLLQKVQQETIGNNSDIRDIIKAEYRVMSSRAHQQKIQFFREDQDEKVIIKKNESESFAVAFDF
jgi:radical SAM superfamily enzyme YgiQ (UPF0313 family)